MEPLYERLGGMEAVARVVFAFYDRVLESPRLAPYFAGVDMRRLIAHQTDFMLSVLGGPPSYTNAHLSAVHRRFNITDRDFDEMIGLFGETMKASGFPQADLDLVLSELRARRPFIVSGSDVGPAR